MKDLKTGGEASAHGEPADLKRYLTFRDVFFLSFGGESPLLSLLTYGAVALSLGGYLAPVILIIGALIVLVNGMVVHRLSTRFTSTGGYYTYAVHSLSERTGFQTGWMYVLYAVLFGSAYVIGAAYIINYVFGFSTILVSLCMTLPAFLFLILGIRPSAKYAIVAGIVEICVLALFFAYSIYLAHFTFYNPLTYQSATSIPAGRLALAILFAMGIPTGYGSIAPISGEIVNAQKVVGRAAISVILAGGAMGAFFMYGLANLIISNGASIRGVTGANGLGVISLIQNYFGGSAEFFIFVLAVGAISDGMLAILSFAAAASRTIFGMGRDRTLPGYFSMQYKGQPLAANAFVGMLMIVICSVILIPLNAVDAFIALGTISSLGGLFIHLAANFSLLRIGLRKARRRVGAGINTVASLLYPYGEALLAIAAVIITSLDLVFSLVSTALIYATLFLAWIVVGYLYSDTREIVFKAPVGRLRPSASGSGSETWRAVGKMTAMEIRSELPDMLVGEEDKLKAAMNKCLEADSPAAVVIDRQGRPAGTLLLRDITTLSDEELNFYSAGDFAKPAVATVTGNEHALALASVFRESGLPIVAIIDNSGKVVGTVREREIIRRIATLREKQKADATDS